MKFNCGTKSFWLPMLLVAGLAMVSLPLFFRRSVVPSPPQPPARAPSPAAPPMPQPLPPAGPPTSSDPVLAQFQTAIRTRNSKGVLDAQAVFLGREGEYREPLRKMAAEDADPRIRAFCVAVLGRMASPPPEAFFVERLRDASEHPRVSALEALGKVGTAGSLATIDGLAASDPAEAVRKAAAQAAKAVRSR